MFSACTGCVYGNNIPSLIITTEKALAFVLSWSLKPYSCPCNNETMQS